MAEASDEAQAAEVNMLKVAMVFACGVALSASASAQEPNKLLKAISDYKAAQTAISFDFDNVTSRV